VDRNRTIRTVAGPLAFRGDDLVFGESHGAVRRVTLADGMLRLVAGGDRWKIQPLAIAFDRQGVLCFSEPATERARTIRP
jgi:hypothetical protein